MNNPSRMFCILVLVAMMAGVPSARAEWPESGVPVCTAASDQRYPAVAEDGCGGMIIAWYDYRSGDNDIYVQRIDATGEARWTPAGLPVCTVTGSQVSPRIISDGEGGAIVTWPDMRAGNYDIYAQRIDASGAVLWTADGIAICAATGAQSSPELVSDGAGGAIVTWYDYRAGNYDIYIQRVDGSGSILWTVGGVALCTVTGSQYYPQIVSDNFGGAVVAWYDYRAGNYDIYAQRVDAAGDPMWDADGVAVCTASGTQTTPRIVSDGACGAIVTWMDNRGGTYDVYVQRIDGWGSTRWMADGVVLCSATGTQRYPEIASDGAGGAIVVWEDNRAGNYDVYTRRVDASGNALWTADGVALCTAAGTQHLPLVVPDGSGGAVAVWNDNRSGDYDLYAQRFDAAGAVSWAAGGVVFCDAAEDQEYQRLIPDGFGGVMAAWQDERSVSLDIYAQAFDGEGRAVLLEPEIRSVSDVPDDQGGTVYLRWNAARLDLLMNETMSHYTIWRAIDAGEAALLIENGAVTLESLSASGAAGQGPVIRTETLAGTTWFWELVDSPDAFYFESYGVTVATLFDSTAVCDEYHYFQVIAHTTDPGVFWISAPDSGRSVDNLSPCAPLALTGTRQYLPDGLLLAWAANAETDLECYRVYRGLGEEFVPSEDNLLGSPRETVCFDSEWSPGTGYCYKVSAVDVNGNESDRALLRSESVTGGDGADTPPAFSLLQNYPNPFNPSTMVAFILAQRAHVRLTIYDPAGRLVRVLMDGTLQAGRHEEAWDGCDGTGGQAASGVYFCRLEAGKFEQTRKIILLR